MFISFNCFTGFPTAISQPHFLHADPVVFNKIDGLNPDSSKHDSEMVVNPVSFNLLLIIQSEVDIYNFFY